MRLSITTKNAYVAIGTLLHILQNSCVNCKIRLHPSLKVRVLRSKDKLPGYSREEIKAMLGLNELRQTKVYQEALEEGEQKARLEAIPELLKEGLNNEQIARALKLPLEVVAQAALQQQSDETTKN
ncbi:MAG: hypothetical protein AB4372_00845 [Xenococcus sp. (in: cyanobacteria)]